MFPNFSVMFTEGSRKHYPDFHYKTMQMLVIYSIDLSYFFWGRLGYLGECFLPLYLSDTSLPICNMAKSKLFKERSNCLL